MRLREVRALPGVGLEGDRYTLKLGTFYKPEPDYELTLIEAEAIEAIKSEYKVGLAPGELRRNLRDARRAPEPFGRPRISHR